MLKLGVYNEGVVISGHTMVTETFQRRAAFHQVEALLVDLPAVHEDRVEGNHVHRELFPSGDDLVSFLVASFHFLRQTRSVLFFGVLNVGFLLISVEDPVFFFLFHACKFHFEQSVLAVGVLLRAALEAEHRYGGG